MRRGERICFIKKVSGCGDDTKAGKGRFCGTGRGRNGIKQECWGGGDVLIVLNNEIGPFGVGVLLNWGGVFN